MTDKQVIDAIIEDARNAVRCVVCGSRCDEMFGDGTRCGQCLYNAKRGLSLQPHQPLSQAEKDALVKEIETP